VSVHVIDNKEQIMATETTKGEMYTVTIGTRAEFDTSKRFHVWLFKRRVAKSLKVCQEDITILGTRPYDPVTKTQEVLLFVENEPVKEYDNEGGVK
jgi:hypothetical protein